jgi:ABC-type nitrate/sulfonate/bicarbonate transport system permease component
MAWRTLLSFVIAAAIGVRGRLCREVEFVPDLFRSIPASALLPPFLVLFGTERRRRSR